MTDLIARLLDAAKAWAREHGATHLELDTAEIRGRAQAFYERQGPSFRTFSFAWAETLLAIPVYETLAPGASGPPGEV